ncbi:MAG: Slp family lipoprotein [Thermodesulfobacteriota bacterium]
MITLLLIATGCSVISKDIRRDIDADITLRSVQSNPEAYRGRKVIWGGVILSLKNLKESTVIEVLHHPLDIRDRVKTRSVSSGRFFIESQGYLDGEIYKKDKEITVAGTIKGTRVEKINEMEYVYPVLAPIEMRLFDPIDDSLYEPSPPFWYYPPYYFDPYYYDTYSCDPTNPHYPYSCVRPYRPYWWYPPYP